MKTFPYQIDFIHFDESLTSAATPISTPIPYVVARNSSKEEQTAMDASGRSALLCADPATGPGEQVWRQDDVLL